MKKKLFYSIGVLAMIIFVAVPLPSSNLYIRFYFDEFEDEVAGDYCTLYYTTDTDSEFSQENRISARIDRDESRVEFCLEPSLENRITSLRLDFPDIQQVVCFKSVTVSNAGVIKRQYNPCDFFSEENMVYINGIYGVNNLAFRGRVFFGTLPEDPHVVLSDALCRQIIGYYSHFRLTRLAICLFLTGCYLLSRLKIFSENSK